MPCSPAQDTETLGDLLNGAEAAEQSCRDFVTRSRQLFNALHDVGSDAARTNLLHEVLAGKDGELDVVCAAGIANVVGASLRTIGAEAQSNRFRESDEISYYPRVIQGYLLVFLFWIWRNRLPLTDLDLSDLVQAVFEGTIGYRLLDIHLDHHGLGAEAVVLGMYLIRRHEHHLARIFGPDRAFPIIKEYADLYASAEYAEKSNRWKSCPFSWSDVKRLGWKAAPLFAILHLILEKAGTPTPKIGAAIEGFCYVAAAIQMMDDFGDVCDDLANGFETLVASGFYGANGAGDITRAKVRSFLEPPRVHMFVRVTLNLLDSAIEAFQRADEPIFELLAQDNKRRFLAGCTSAPALARFRMGGEHGNNNTD